MILWNNIHISALSYPKAQSASGTEFKGLLICKVWMCLRLWSLNLIIVPDHNGAGHWSSPLWIWYVLRNLSYGLIQSEHSNSTYGKGYHGFCSRPQLWAYSGSHPCECLWNHSDQCSADKIRHGHLISYCHIAVLFCCLWASVACTPYWAANNWVLVILFQSVVYLPAITGASLCKWLLCILRKISNDFHLSMQLWLFREFPLVLNFFFFLFHFPCNVLQAQDDRNSISLAN